MNTEHLADAFFALTIAGSLALNYLIIRKTKGPKERRFMIRASLASWTGIVFFAVLAAGFPRLHLGTGMGAIGVICFAGVRSKQLEIRRLEAHP